MSFFYGIKEYPFLQPLADNWQTILEEYKNVQAAAIEWPEKDIYTDGWNVVGLRFMGHEFEESQGVSSAASDVYKRQILKAGTVIHPHEGYTDKVYRVHLGLICPEGAWIKVGNQVNTWKDGEVFVFDDTITHEVQNNAETDRVILLMDFLKDTPT